MRALDAAVEAMPAPHVSAETYYASSTRSTTSPAGEPTPTWRARRADALAAMAETFLQHGLDQLAGEPLDVGRRTRAIPPALRRALQARDRGCRFPGCTHRRFVDGHHVHHWANGGETKLANLVLLCRFHHRLVHEGGFGVQRLDDGALRFVRPDGSAIATVSLSHAAHASAPDRPAAADAADVARLRAAHAAAGLAIDADTPVPGWRGERMDYGLAVEALLRCRERAARGSPGRAGLQS